MMIRKKKIRVTKLPTKQQMQRIKVQAKDCWTNVTKHLQNRFEIIYCDEVTFSIKTQLTNAYSLPNAPLQIDYKQFSPHCIAAIVCISLTKGIEIVDLYDKSVNIQKFACFLEKLRRLHFADDIAIFVDQLSVHRSKIIQERLDELSIPCIFNAAYSPDFNPIENIFAIAKTNYKKIRLNQIMEQKKENVKQNII